MDAIINEIQRNERVYVQFTQGVVGVPAINNRLNRFTHIIDSLDHIRSSYTLNQCRFNRVGYFNDYNNFNNILKLYREDMF
jgi:hypothetical protein